MQTFGDTLSQVFRAIAANKLRSFLTMFGIAWGVGSLLVLVGLGEGFRSGQHRNLATFGNDVVLMWNGTIPAVANQHTGMRPYQLTLGDAEAMKQLPEVRDVTVELSRSDLYEVSQWSNTSSHAIGVQPNYTAVRFIPMAQGRFLNDADVAERRRVAVLGFKARNLLFPGRPLLGETITINGTEFAVIGSVDKISRGNNDYDDQKLYIPITTMQELFALKGENIARDALTSIQYQPTQRPLMLTQCGRACLRRPGGSMPRPQFPRLPPTQAHPCARLPPKPQAYASLSKSVPAGAANPQPIAPPWAPHSSGRRQDSP